MRAQFTLSGTPAPEARTASFHIAHVRTWRLPSRCRAPTIDAHM
jgi:hypothetical protein